MRLGVTGAGGGIGKEVMLRARALGHEAIPMPSREQLDLLGEISRVTDWLNSKRPDALIHLAGATPPSSAAALFAQNVGTTYSVFSASARAGMIHRIVVTSSAAVYGAVDVPCSVDLPLSPLNPYGASKAAEEYVAGVTGAASGIDAVIARPFNVVGVSSDTRSVLPALLSRVSEAADGETIAVKNLNAVRDFVHVQDVAKIIVDAAVAPRPPAIFNIGSGKGLTIEWLARSIARIMNRTVRFVNEDGPAAAAVACSIASTAELDAMGWRCRPLDEDMLAGIIAEMRTKTANQTDECRER